MEKNQLCEYLETSQPGAKDLQSKSLGERRGSQWEGTAIAYDYMGPKRVGM